MKVRIATITAAAVLLFVSAAQAQREDLSRSAWMGRDIVRRHCAPCHGLEGDGQGSMRVLFKNDPGTFAPPKLIEAAKKDELKEAIAQIAAKKLELAEQIPHAAEVPQDVELSDLLKFLGGSKPFPHKGAFDYRNHCMACHGLYGGCEAIGAKARKMNPARLSRSEPLKSIDTFHINQSLRKGLALSTHGKAVPHKMPKIAQNDVYDLELDNAIDYAKKLHPGIGAYFKWCAYCHGRSPPMNLRDPEATEAVKRKLKTGSVAPDKLRKPRRHFMRKLGTIEIEDLQEYLKTMKVEKK